MSRVETFDFICTEVVLHASIKKPVGKGVPTKPLTDRIINMAS